MLGKSFRPLSGYLISKSGMNLTTGLTNLGFPSPLGVSYFQIDILNCRCAQSHGFPSPLGVSYFQMMK